MSEAADATKSILDVGVVGAVCILLLLGLVYAVKLVLKKQDEVLEEKEKRLTDHKEFFLAQSEIIRRYLEGAAETSKATLEALRDRRPN